MDTRYQLVDFGGGRKLEQIGRHRIIRPSPAADSIRRADPSIWNDPDAEFVLAQKAWRHHRSWPKDCEIDCGGFVMPVRPTPFGHLGVFPEQAANWRWLGEIDCKPLDEPAALNLFGYTGASSMALAKAGFSIAHVDAAKPNVQACREAAERNGLADHPIRYLVDDAAKFAAREVRRGRNYHTIVLDPPAYGHAPGGKAWRLERDLWPLLEDCLRLVDPQRFRLLITGHSPQIDERDVVAFLQEHQSGGLLVAKPVRIEAGRSQLKDESDRSLDAGFFVRVVSSEDEC